MTSPTCSEKDTQISELVSLGHLEILPMDKCEKHLEGGWIGASANLEQNAKLSALNAEA